MAPPTRVTTESELANGHGNGSNGNGSNGNGITAARHHFSTRVIHDGSQASEETGAVIPGINLSTTYKQTAVGVHKVWTILQAVTAAGSI